MKTSVVLLCITLLLAAALTAAKVPQMINYQARLTNSLGEPLDTVVSITFTIYDDSVSRSIKWTETHPNVNVVNGLFSVLLGSVDSLKDTVFAGEERYLGITVGDDPEIVPRTKIVAASYAHRVSTIDGAEAGVLSGLVEIAPTSSKEGRLSDPALIVRGSDADSVVISPIDDFALHATGNNGDELILLSTVADAGAAKFSASDGLKAITRTVEIDPGNNVVLGATEENGDGTVTITSSAAGAALHVSATDVAKGIKRTVDIVPAQNVALRAKEQNGDEVLLLSASETGGAIEVNQSDALKGIIGKVKIKPSEDIALAAIDDNDSALVKISTADSEGSISLLSNTAKGWEQVKIGRNAIYFFGPGRSDTNLIISADGSIRGKGQISMGQDHADLSSWNNVIGVHNSATGDSAVVSGGYYNEASGFVATVAGGSHNTASGDWSTVSGGLLNTAWALGSTVPGGYQNTTIGDYSVAAGGAFNLANNIYSVIGGGFRNQVDAEYSAILGGFGDTIAYTAPCSYLFGIRSKLTQDSTFMVDMPHIRFGDEYSGYEFPAADGAYGQYLVTDGSGVLSWTSAGGFSNNIKLNGNWLSNDGGNEGVYVATDGNVGISTDHPGSKLAVSGLTGTSSYNNVRVNTATGDFYYESSTERNKKDIRPFEEDFEKIFQAQPKTFTDKASGQREIGFIAEEFDALGLSDLVIYDADGRPNGLRYERISLYLLEVLKDKSDKLAQVESKLARFEVLLQQLIENQQ